MSKKITAFFIPNKRIRLEDVTVNSSDPTTSSSETTTTSKSTSTSSSETTTISKPTCWSEQQCIDFKEKNPWLVAEEQLACNICRSVSNLGAEKTQGLKLSQQWVLGTVGSYGKDKAEQQKSLRKKIVEHRGSAAHKAAEKIFSLAKKNSLQESVAKMSQEQQETTERVFRTAYKQAKLNRPFYEFESEIDLQICNGLDMGRILHSNVACSNVVHHISTEMQADLVKKVFESNAVFSLILDESTSLSNKTCLIVYVRTQIEGMEKPKNIFLTLIELTSLSASGILKDLLNELYRLGFNSEFIKNHLISVTCDGAAVMLGKNTGFAKQLTELFPNLIIWHCLNHRLELGVNDAIKEVSGVNHFKFFMDKLRNIYSNSPKNTRQLAEVAKNLEEEIVKVGRVLDTRWVSSSLSAVKAVWRNYTALFSHFQQASNDPERDSKNRCTYLSLSNTLSSTTFVHNLALMYDALEELSDLSLQLQKENINLVQAHNDISLMIKVFESRIDHNGKHFVEAQCSIEKMVFKEVPLIERPKIPKIPSKQFYRSLANNMTNRLYGSENAGEKFEDVLSDIKVVYPRYWPAQMEITYGEESIVRLCEKFKVANPQEVIRDFREFKQGMMPTFTGGKPNVLEEPPNLKRLISAVNTVAVSSAECERGFSAMNLIMVPTRCSLHVKTVNDLLFIKLVGPPITEYKPERHVKSWLSRGRHSAIDTKSKERCPKEHEKDNYVLWKCFS